MDEELWKAVFGVYFKCSGKSKETVGSQRRVGMG